MKKDVSKNRTKNILKNICISTAILFLGLIVILKSFEVQEERKTLLYSYNMNKNVNYTVDLIENDYFTTQTLEMNKAYISSLVKNINMDFRYSLSGSKKAKTKYTYQIVAVSNVKYDGSSKEDSETIWQKQYVLVEPKQMEVDSPNFVINESISLDFASYNNEVVEFKKQMRLPISADLVVKLIVRSDTDVPEIEDTVIESSIMNVKMNLNEDVFKVEPQFKNADNKEIYETIKGSKKVNKFGVAVGGICVVLAIMIILDSIRKSIKFSQKSDYAIALNRILKNYGDIVAEIVSPVEIDNLNIIDVKNFDQLLDIEEEIRMPILFYETIEGEQGEFIIVCDNMAYRYVIGK